jgi:hypothetical protein
MAHGSNTEPPIRMKTGAEYDALTRARKYYCYLDRAGAAASIKRGYRRRYRRILKSRLNRELYNTATEGN